MDRKLVGLGLCFVVLLGLAGPARADVVIDWNNQLLAAIRLDKTPPPMAGRAMAMVHVAIFDAVEGIAGGYTPYAANEGAPPGASPEAAATAAGHQVLISLFPDQRAALDIALASSLAKIPEGGPKRSGILWGRSVADRLLAVRASDHSTEGVDYNSPVGSSWWMRTPPTFSEPALPHWAFVKPWAMTSGSQFRQGAPPPIGCPEYAEAFREIQEFGGADSEARTEEQTAIARFWADGVGTVTPPGHWMLIAQGISQQRHLTLIENARLFALLGIAVADAAVVSWDHKYYYNFWRPITAVQNAEKDGNPETEVDPAWKPLILTPPFPTYTSGHSTFSAAAATILELFFGSDPIPFTTTSDGLPGIQRSFNNFWQAAEEAGQSRIYGGIHFQFDNQAGLASGRALAGYVFTNFLLPVSAPSTCKADANTLCLGPQGRFKAQVAWKSDAAQGAGHAVPLTPNSGSFWFFGADILDLNVQVIDACIFKGDFWVYVQGVSDVEVVLTLTDTRTGRSRQYYNPLGKVFPTLRDKSAFPCSPSSTRENPQGRGEPLEESGSR